MLPSPGPVTRTVEASEARGVAPIAGVTLREMKFRGAPLFRPKALSERVGLGLAGGGAFRANSSVEPVGRKRIVESAGGALRDCPDEYSERDSFVSEAFVTAAGGLTAGA